MKVIAAVLLCVVSATAFAAQRVDGYTRKDGTYVAPHYRSSPNSTKLDNYGTQGNVNPYTGQKGYVDPYGAPNPSPRPKSPKRNLY